MRVSLQPHSMHNMQQAIWRSPVWRMAFELLLAAVLGAAIGLAVIVSTRFVENWKLIAGLVGGPLFILITLRWPEYSILALAGLTIGVVDSNWMPLLRMGPASIHIQEIMLGVLLGLLVFRSATWRDFQLRNTPLSIFVLLFLFAVVLAVFNGVFNFGLGINTVVQRGRNLLLWTAFFPVVQLVRDRASLDRLVFGLWAITALLAIGVLVRIVIPGLHPFIFPVEIEQLRTMGTQFSGVGRVFQYRGGALLYAMLPVIVAVFAFADEVRLSFTRYVLLMGLLALVSNWLFRSFQRSMWVSSALVLVLLFLMIANQDRARLLRRMLPLVVVLPLLFFIYWRMFPRETEKLVEAGLDRIGSLTSNLARSDDSVDWRIIETRYAMESVRAHPVLGIGPGNEYRPPLEREILWNEYGLRWYIHNAYLWITVLLGFVGLLPFMALSALYLFRTFYFWQSIDDDMLRAVYLGLGLSFLGQMISNNTQPTFFDGPAQSIYPILIGVSECILFLSRQERSAA